MKACVAYTNEQREVLAEQFRNVLKARLEGWGNWRRKCANNPGLSYQSQNLIARMQGEIIVDRRDWSAEEEMDYFVQVVTFLYPHYGAALVARYAHQPIGRDYHERQADTVAYFNRLLTDGGHIDKNRSVAYFRQTLAQGVAAVSGYLRSSLDGLA